MSKTGMTYGIGDVVFKKDFTPNASLWQRQPGERISYTTYKQISEFEDNTAFLVLAFRKNDNRGALYVVEVLAENKIWIFDYMCILGKFHNGA